MPRHPPIALKTLDRSHCQCPPRAHAHGRYWHKKTSFSRSMRWPAVKPPIICGELSVPRDKPPKVESGSIFSSRCQAEQAAGRSQPQTLFFNECLPEGWPATRSSKSEGWWSRTGSNRRPPACKAGALPAELRPLDKEMVGLGGLEPPTSRLSSARSNQLSYKPLNHTQLAAVRPRQGGLVNTREERETKAADPLKVCAT
jgi:hypothetical protein